MSAHDMVRILRQRGYVAQVDNGQAFGLVEWRDPGAHSYATESRFEPVTRLSDWT